jgi:hypothetical protein
MPSFLEWIEAARFIKLEKEGKILRKGSENLLKEAKKKTGEVSRARFGCVVKNRLYRA